MHTDHRLMLFICIYHNPRYLYDNLMADEKCVNFGRGCKRDRATEEGVGVLMQVLNMQCVSDLAG